MANRPLESTSYAYDDAGQLTTAASTDDLLDADYAYGPNGNRGLASDAGGGQNVYVHAAGNRLLTTDEFGAGTDFTYVHDAEGSLLERRRTAGNVLDQRYSYDHRNRLTKAEVFSSGGVLQTTIEYRYDAAGEVVLRRETPAGNAASWEHFVTLGGQRGLTLAETGATDRPSRLYSHGPLGEVQFERTLSTAAATAGVQLDVELPLADHQLTTRAVLDGDDAGASALRVRQSVDYAPLGRVVRLRDGAGQPLVDGAGAPNLAALDVALASFHGQESDPRTGLVKMGARWYSPTTGRFTSEDPIGEGTNWYEFAGNDPVNYADPTGLSQAGHPLAGGYSGGVTTASKIPVGAPTFNYNTLFAPTPGPTQSSSSFARSSTNYAFPSGSSLLGPTSALLAPAATTSRANAAAYSPIGSGLSTANNSGPLRSLLSPTPSPQLGEIQRVQNEQTSRALRQAIGYELQEIERAQVRRVGLQAEATSFADQATAATPYVSTGRDVAELVAGRNLVTDERLTGFNRFLTAVGVATPVAGAWLRQALGTASDGSRLLTEFEGRVDPANIQNLERRSRVVQGQNYEDQLVGAASDVASHRRIVPALPYNNPKPNGKPYVRFDGVDPVDPLVVIDRKLNVTTKSGQIKQLQRQADVLKQNPGYSLRIEVPNAAAARAANKALDSAGVRSAPISVRVVP